MPFLEGDSIQIHYKYFYRSNSMETIVFIHGLGLNLTTWNVLWDYFKNDYNLVLYDIRGHGYSGGGHDVSFEKLTNDLLLLVDSLKINYFHIVGHGIGGIIGVRFAHNYQKRLRSLTLISSQLHYLAPLLNDMFTKRRFVTVSGSLESLAEEIINRICINPTSEIKHELIQAFNQITLATYFNYFGFDRTEYNLIPYLNSIHIPVLCLAGEYDRIIPSYFYGFCASFFPNSRFVILQNVSNAIFIDDPKNTANLIIENIENTICNDNKEIQKRTIQIKHNELIQNLIYEGLTSSSVEEISCLVMNVIHNFHVYLNGKELKNGWNRRKAKELLLYLILHPTSTRDEIIELFWKEFPLKNARNQLRVCLNYLKSLIGSTLDEKYSNMLIIDNNTVSLKGDIHSDVLDLLEKIYSANMEFDIETKRILCHEIIDRLPKNFLNGFFDDWVIDLKEKILDHLTIFSSWLANYYETRSDYLQAIHYYKLVIEMNPNIDIYDKVIQYYKKLNRIDDAQLWRKKRDEYFIEKS